MYSYAYIQIKHILFGFRDCRYVLELAVGLGWGGGGFERRIDCVCIGRFRCAIQSEKFESRPATFPEIRYSCITKRIKVSLMFWWLGELIKKRAKISNPFSSPESSARRLPQLWRINRFPWLCIFIFLSGHTGPLDTTLFRTFIL